MPRILALTLSLLLPYLSLAAEDSKDLKMAIYRVPPSVFMKSVDAKGEGGWLFDGVKKISPSPFYGVDDVYDVQSFLKSQGIQFPEGAQAVLVGKEGILWVKNTAENLGNLGALFNDGTCDPPILLRNEISVVQFKSQQRNLESRPLTFPELVKAAGDSWKQVCSLEIVSKSGQIVETATSSGTFASRQPDKTPHAPVMQPNDEGATCAIEDIIGPDGFNIDSNLSFRYQSKKGENSAPLTIVYDGSSSFWDGHPQVLQCISNDKSQLSYALIMSITLAFPDACPLKQVDKNHPGTP